MRQRPARIADVLFQENKSQMPREPIKVGRLCDFSSKRKAVLIRVDVPFQKVTPKSGSAKGQLDHSNTFG